MVEIIGQNINDVFADSLQYLLDCGIEEKSRNGAVIVAKEPVTITYLMPAQKVLFSPIRDANPFFHMMESLWMLGGRNDIAWPQFFNKRFGSYSDDGILQRGAYGHRWRKHFGFDQLERIVDELIKNPNSRRCVLSMWGANDLEVLHQNFVDYPCNTHAYFDLRGDVLNMTVCNRSNDAIWGAFGANAVHFAFLQEYLAAWLKKPVGKYRQFTNNLHIYTDIYNREGIKEMAYQARAYNLYRNLDMRPPMLVTKDIETFDADLHHFLADPAGATFSEPFFKYVAQPMYQAWAARKSGSGTGREQCVMVTAKDWRYAGLQWIQRREKVGHAG